MTQTKMFNLTVLWPSNQVHPCTLLRNPLAYNYNNNVVGQLQLVIDYPQLLATLVSVFHAYIFTFAIIHLVTFFTGATIITMDIVHFCISLPSYCKVSHIQKWHQLQLHNNIVVILAFIEYSECRMPSNQGRIIAWLNSIPPLKIDSMS